MTRPCSTGCWHSVASSRTPVPRPTARSTSAGPRACGGGPDWLATPALQFAPEDVEIHADLAVIQWRLRWGEGPQDHARGVNLMRVQNGEIVEARGYIKA